MCRVHVCACMCMRMYVCVCTVVVNCSRCVMCCHVIPDWCMLLQVT